MQQKPAFQPDFQVSSLSDRSVIVSFGNAISEAINEQVLSLHHILLQSAFTGFIESVPAYASLAVFYDPQQVRQTYSAPAYDFVQAHLRRILQQGHTINQNPGKLVKIPVCYDPVLGMDIQDMAGIHRLSIDEVVCLHTAITYRVYMIGFLPGFAYMGTVDERLITPRKQQPRLIVPAGSVGIAGAQTGIYPFESPGGWQIIGRTPCSLFDESSSTPCLLAAGDQVQFFSIDIQHFNNSYVR